MAHKLKINGVYNKETITLLEENKVNDFSFDLRPKSFSFIQEYKTIEILETIYRPWNKYYFHFEREEDYIISKFVEDFKNSILKSKTDIDKVDNIYLEFSDERDFDFYELFKTPYLIHLNDASKLNKFLDVKYLRGIVLPYSFLEFIKNNGTFGNFVTSFLKQCASIQGDNEFQKHLLINWNDSIFPSLFDYLNFNCICLPMNNFVEHSYRNVNFDALESYISQYRKLSP